jgi:hypothetical protein
LDPAEVASQLQEIAGGSSVALTCWEGADAIARGDSFCYRHLAAAWLSAALDIEVDELGAPDGFEAFAFLRMRGIAPPCYLSQFDTVRAFTGR